MSTVEQTVPLSAQTRSERLVRFLTRAPIHFGLIAIALLAITGPVIEVEDRPVRGALRRSAQLIRSQFWRCFLIAGLPLILINELEALLPEPHGPGEIAEVLAIKGIAEGVLEAALSLVLVSLTFALIAMEKTARQAAAAEGAR